MYKLGFIESNKGLTIFLFICIWSKKSALVQLVIYQLFNFLLSLELKSHTPETKSQFTPEHLISAPGDLTMSNLAYTARLLEWERPTLLGKGKSEVKLHSRRGHECPNWARDIALLFP